MMKSTDEPIIFEENFNTSINKIWNAITKAAEMKQWFFENIESFRPEVGFKTKFEVVVKSRKFTHLWKLTEVIPYQKITYNWNYEEYPGDSYVTFELTEKQNYVTLTITHRVVESFPEGISEFSRENGLAGWDYFIKKNLKEYLESNSK